MAPAQWRKRDGRFSHRLRHSAPHRTSRRSFHYPENYRPRELSAMRTFLNEGTLVQLEGLLKLFRLFITIGPCHATGSRSGAQKSEGSAPCSPDVTSNLISSSKHDQCSVAGLITDLQLFTANSFSTLTPNSAEALPNLALPSKIYANPWRRVSKGNRFVVFAGSAISRYCGSVSIPSTGPRYRIISNDPNMCAIVISQVGYVLRLNVLIAWRRHFLIARQIGPQLEPVHCAGIVLNGIS